MTVGSLPTDKQTAWLPYLLLGAAQWLGGVTLYAVPALWILVPPMGAWVFSQTLLIGTLLGDLGLEATRGTVWVAWAAHYLLGGLVLWLICERVLAWRRWTSWRRALVAWGVAQGLYLILIAILAATGYLAE